MFKKIYLTLIGIISIVKLSLAQDSTSTGKFSFSGYVDTYFFTNFNRPASRSNTGNSGVSRGFDRNADQFQLGMVQTMMTYSTKKSEIVADLAFGPNADYGNYGNVFGYLGNSVYTAAAIKQAYFKYKATEKLSFIAGQFGTHIGYELIDAPLNFFYSINNTFNCGIPFYHIGAKSEYQPNDKVKMMLGVVNGTDMLNDNNRAKSIIGQLTLTPNENTAIYLNYIGGNEANPKLNGKDSTSFFQVFDLVASRKVGEKLTLVTWMMLGTLKGSFQGGPDFPTRKAWGGANLYIIYDVSETFSIGARAEYFDNTNGVRALQTNGRGTDVKSFTITGNFTLADGHLLLKPEFRTDIFKKMSYGAGEEAIQQFMDKNGNYTKNSQSTFGMAAIYKF
ncbi:MAG: porin [Flammeovirgaceae bacterium]|nr:porin [Flammeovirgaceae bacterium]MDW8287229.1 porin [Flammeovirgaceae bacterium]